MNKMVEQILKETGAMTKKGVSDIRNIVWDKFSDRWVISYKGNKMPDEFEMFDMAYEFLLVEYYEKSIKKK